MKLKYILIFLIVLLISVSAVSAENETVTNSYNSDINDTQYINPNDYYINEDGNTVPYTSYTGSYNNVTMSNGYNAYAIQNGGYIESNDSKTHPSFYNDTFYVVDANDTQTAVGHYYYTNKTPIGEYLKILFFRYHDYLQNLNKNSPNIPNSIFVQSFVWDFYKNGGDIDKLQYTANKYAVQLYNNGYRVNNTGNIQWINETTYRIFDFLAFRNTNSSHKDLWGLKIRLFTIPPENNTNKTNSSVENNTNQFSSNKTKPAKTFRNDTNVSKKTNNTTNSIKTNDNKLSNNNKSNDNILNKYKKEIIDLNKKTGNPTLLYILICIILCALFIFMVEKFFKK